MYIFTIFSSTLRWCNLHHNRLTKCLCALWISLGGGDNDCLLYPLLLVVRLLEQAPDQMGEGAVRWAKLVIPLVVHSASKVRLRAAAALEMGMPLLLERQQEVAAIMEPLLSTVSLSYCQLSEKCLDRKVCPVRIGQGRRFAQG